MIWMNKMIFLVYFFRNLIMYSFAWTFEVELLAITNKILFSKELQQQGRSAMATTNFRRFSIQSKEIEGLV